MNAFWAVVFLILLIGPVLDHGCVQAAAPRKGRNKRAKRKAPLSSALSTSANLSAHADHQNSEPVDIAEVLSQIGSESAIFDIKFKPSPSKELAATLSKEASIGSELSERMKRDFDWRAYLYMHPDLLAAGLQTQYFAEQHYLLFGRHEPRVFPRRLPSKRSLKEAKAKLEEYLTKLQARHVHVSQRAMVIYHIGFPKPEQSMDILYNNLALFLRAVLSDSEQEVPRAFYWLNLIGGARNPLYPYVHTLLSPAPAAAPLSPASSNSDQRLNYSNIVVVDWNASPHPMYTHLRTLALIPRTLTQHFHVALLASFEARGLLGQRARGAWLQVFVDVFARHPEVGMMGPLLSCEKIPHLPPFVLAVKTDLAPKIVSFYQKPVVFSSHAHWRRHFEEQVSQFARGTLNASLASLLYAQLGRDGSGDGDGVFRGCLRSPATPLSAVSTPPDPRRWCQPPLPPLPALLFAAYGDAHSDRYTCRSAKDALEALLLDAALREDQGGASSARSLALRLPESRAGGPWDAVFREASLEAARDWNHALFNLAANFSYALPSAREEGVSSSLVPSSIASLLVPSHTSASPPQPLLLLPAPLREYWLRILNARNRNNIRDVPRDILHHPAIAGEQQAAGATTTTTSNNNKYYMNNMNSDVSADKVCFLLPCCGTSASYRSSADPSLPALLARHLQQVGVGNATAQQHVSSLSAEELEEAFLLPGRREQRLRLQLQRLVASLQRQTSPHWQLHVYAGDQQAQQRRASIASLLQSFGDPRVRLLELPADTRLENSTAASGGLPALPPLLASLRQLLSPPPPSPSSSSSSSCALAAVLPSPSLVLGSNLVFEALARGSEAVEAGLWGEEGGVALAAVESVHGAYAEVHHPRSKREGHAGHCAPLLSALQTQPLAFAHHPAQHKPLQSRNTRRDANAGELLALSAGIFVQAPRSPAARERIFTLYSSLFSSSSAPLFLHQLFPPSAVISLPLSFQHLLFTTPSPVYCISMGLVWVDHPHLPYTHCATPEHVDAYFSAFPHPFHPAHVSVLNEFTLEAAGDRGRTAAGGGGGDGFYFDVFDRKDFELGGRKCLRLSSRGHALFTKTAV